MAGEGALSALKRNKFRDRFGRLMRWQGWCIRTFMALGRSGHMWNSYLIFHPNFGTKINQNFAAAATALHHPSSTDACYLNTLKPLELGWCWLAYLSDFVSPRISPGGKLGEPIRSSLADSIFWELPLRAVPTRESNVENEALIILFEVVWIQKTLLKLCWQTNEIRCWIFLTNLYVN